MQSFFKTTLKITLFLVPIIPLIVMRSLLFPFITGKHFPFRVVVEFAALLWLILAVRYGEYRPKKSALLWAVGIFIAAIGIADLLGIDPSRSLWSNYERMEGFIGLLHFFLYFFVLSHVLKKEREWMWLFYTSIGVSVIECLYGIFQLLGMLEIHQSGTRLDGTIGNATYLAVYLLGHLFLLMYLFFREKSLLLRITFGGIFLLESFVLYHTATRGAIIAFFAGLLFFLLLLLFQVKGRARLAGAGVLVVLVLMPPALYAIRNTSLVKKSEPLSRLESISLKDQTTQSRIIIWGMALQGWEARPVLGWGQENFGYVFSKYYDPRLFKQEPWFDRAHNIFLDWLTAGGLVGLLSYLSIYGAAFLIIRRLRRADRISGPQSAVLTSLFVALFIQNFFVFDNYTSYYLFFTFLAFLHSMEVSRVMAPAHQGERQKKGSSHGISPQRTPLSTAVVIISIPFFLFVVYKVNIKPYFVANATIEALSVLSHRGSTPRDIDQGIAIYTQAIDQNTFGTTEVRDQITQAVNVIIGDPNIPQEDKKKFLKFAISEMEKQVARSEYDLRAKAFLANLYSIWGIADKAIAVSQDALKVSDKRQLFYFVMAEALITKGNYEQARTVLQRAFDLDTDNGQALYNLALTIIASGKPQEAEVLLRRYTGSPFISDRRFVNVYLRINDIDGATHVWEQLVKGEPKNTDNYIGLAGILVKQGLRDQAIEVLEKAKQVKPSIASDIDKAIEQIRAGKEI